MCNWLHHLVPTVFSFSSGVFSYLRFVLDQVPHPKIVLGAHSRFVVAVGDHLCWSHRGVVVHRGVAGVVVAVEHRGVAGVAVAVVAVVHRGVAADRAEVGRKDARYCVADRVEDSLTLHNATP